MHVFFFNQRGGLNSAPADAQLSILHTALVFTFGSDQLGKLCGISRDAGKFS
jgi:hypothetical protein